LAAVKRQEKQRKIGNNEMKERDGRHERKTPPETKFTDIVLRYILRHIIKSF